MGCPRWRVLLPAASLHRFAILRVAAAVAANRRLATSCPTHVVESVQASTESLRVPSALAPKTTAERSRDRHGLFLQVAHRVLVPLTVAFAVLTTVHFLGPSLILGAPTSLREPIRAIYEVLLPVLVAVQLAVLALATPLLILSLSSGPLSRLHLLTPGAAIFTAVVNAARLALGARGAGLGPALAETVLFTAPLALLSVSVWQRIPRDVKLWWVGPLRLILVGFPLVFLMTALSRTDLRLDASATVPLSVAWFLAYGPTLTVAILPLTSWIALESYYAPVRLFVIDAVLVLSVSVLVGVATSLNSFAAFVLSATVTWGSGYQLFAAPRPFPILFLSFLLLSAAFVAFAESLFRLRQRGSSTRAPLLGLVVVLSGVFPSVVSVLGSLAAVELIGIEVSRSVRGRVTLPPGLPLTTPSTPQEQDKDAGHEGRDHTEDDSAQEKIGFGTRG